MLNVPLRRVFRALWGLCAIGCLAALPTLVLDFKRNHYSVHYQVPSRTPLRRLLRTAFAFLFPSARMRSNHAPDGNPACDAIVVVLALPTFLAQIHFNIPSFLIHAAE